MYQNEPLDIEAASNGYVKLEDFVSLVEGLAPSDFTAACQPQTVKTPAAGADGTSF